MKINSINHVNMNPYTRQNQPSSMKNEEMMNKSDELQISTEAKELQSSEQISPSRQEKLQDIKDRIEAGQYHADPMKVARKFYEYWKN
ncbi:anti-sigma-28 factor, FlgM family [Fictibacillus enclensis]|uniref:Negative regulator of flagellin synthesis n=1 Tax=Fictibacillus enclensis TaxID=1017270 RepID=A0A0V8J8D8_9BACL|nr:flagellar biosynthesis anti-sigma factor FlgM [Fictibacillus enclensis]KSU83096.1 hypothetical protein AS030_10940 [Fictibacillus enclensis]SCC10052.1 anti-sigma-28 factor, FlgM family [Fictibacillus enclensis]